MTARERILALRLIKMQDKNPAYAKRIGIQVSMVKKEPKDSEGKHV